MKRTLKKGQSSRAPSLFHLALVKPDGTLLQTWDVLLTDRTAETDGFNLSAAVRSVALMREIRDVLYAQKKKKTK